jgi:hypothetical protein
LAGERKTVVFFTIQKVDGAGNSSVVAVYPAEVSWGAAAELSIHMLREFDPAGFDQFEQKFGPLIKPVQGNSLGAASLPGGYLLRPSGEPYLFAKPNGDRFRYRVEIRTVRGENGQMEPDIRLIPEKLPPRSAPSPQSIPPSVAPPSRGGLEESIDLPAGATNQRVIILTPDTAAAGLQLLGGFRAGAEEKIGVAVIVRDQTQYDEISAGLEEAGVALLYPIVNLSATGQSLGEAIVQLQMSAWGASLETLVIETLDALRALGKFLQIPEVGVRLLDKRLDEMGVASQA